ncbi:MAG: hypothetical protein EBV03_00795 [Proteobacteria bacterium]|nr:hypothetical protein [Pseudomonadota bacterium]
MVTSVTLGTFFNVGGKTVLGGTGGSGLDTQSLIKSLTEAKRQPIKISQDKIDLNDKKSAALSEFQNLLNSYKSSLDALRNPPGVGNDADNVFRFRVGSVPPIASNYVNISTSAGAAIQSYEIRDIESVATVARQGTGTFAVANADTDVVGGGGVNFSPGEITFNGETITIENTDTLNIIASKFNAVSANTKVTATVVNVGPNNFQLSFVSTVTGTSGNFDLSAATDPNGVLTNIGLTAPVDATNAKFKLNGIQIERETNTVNDVISGVTFNILQETPDAVTPYIVSVKPDTQTVQSVINRFVQDYNALKAFEAKQTKLNADGTFGKDSLLVNNQTFLSIMNQVNSMVNSKVAGITGNNPASLVDIGLSFIAVPGTKDTPDLTNALNVNDGQLTSALNANFDGVSKLFGFYLTSDNTNLTIFSRTNAVSVTNFTLDIDAVTVDLVATPLTGGIDGYVLKGASGSAIEGLELIYASTAAAPNINVTLSQGVADRLFNAVDAAVKNDSGSLALELDDIQGFTDRLNKDIENTNKQVDVYQEQLLARFTALEQAIARVNNLLSSLDANSTARQVAANS